MSKRRKFFLILSVLLWEAIDISFVLVVPIYAAMFADFKPPLPVTTQACIDLANFRHGHIAFYYPLFFGSLAMATVVAVKKENKRFALGFVVASFLAVIVFVLSLLFPVFQLGSIATK